MAAPAQLAGLPAAAELTRWVAGLYWERETGGCDADYSLR
jgi:hypothetical protein